jgi:heat shock protein HslJ
VIRRTFASLAVVAVVAACNIVGGGGGDSLTGQVWQWTGLVESDPPAQSAPGDPENYTIEFHDDGTFAAKADCNQVAGAYESSGGSLTITPSQSTMAACGDESLDQIFLTNLALAQSYAIEDGGLDITLSNGGEMQFD